MKWTVDQLQGHFGQAEFSGTDFAAVAGLKNYRGSGAILASLVRKRMLDKTKHGYRLHSNGTVPATPIPPTEQPVPVATSTPCVIKINGYYIAPRAILIVDTLQNDKVVIHTSILEIDGETKHPRNKKLIFTRQHAPDEYQAVIAWLRENADVPIPATQSEDTQVALQLAEEATVKLAAAEKEIEALKKKVAQFRALLD